MALSITAAVDPVTWSVRLTVTGGAAPYAYTVTASPAGVDDYTVRGPQAPVTGAPSTRVLTDGGVPLNTPTVYTARDTAGGIATSATVTVTSTVPVLSDATNPAAALAVTVVSQKPDTWAARSVWWDILGSAVPFASVAPMRARNGDLVLRVDNPTARASLLRQLLTGNPQLLRTARPEAVDPVTLLPESVTDDLIVSGDDAGGPVNVTVTYQAISSDLGITYGTPGRTYATVLPESATYAAVVAGFATYADWLTGTGILSAYGPNLITGTFASGTLTGFTTFWTGTGITWSAAAGDATATATTGGNNASISSDAAAYSVPVVAGKRIRVAGRVKVSAPGVVPTLDVLVATAPNVADYFQPGATVATYAITAAAPGVWASFVVLATVPGGANRATPTFRVNPMSVGTVSWDDLDIRLEL